MGDPINITIVTIIAKISLTKAVSEHTGVI